MRIASPDGLRVADAWAATFLCPNRIP
jgi:hypothetical protein